MCVLDEVAASVALYASFSAHSWCTQAAACKQAEPWFQGDPGGVRLVAIHLLAATLYTCTEWELLATVFLAETNLGLKP